MKITPWLKLSLNEDKNDPLLMELIEESEKAGSLCTRVMGAGGGGFFQGENGNRGDSTNGKGDIFRTHESVLNTSVTIASSENSLCAGPLTVSTSGTVNLTVNGNLTIV